MRKVLQCRQKVKLNGFQQSQEDAHRASTDTLRLIKTRLFMRKKEQHSFNSFASAFGTNGFTGSKTFRAFHPSDTMTGYAKTGFDFSFTLTGNTFLVPLLVAAGTIDMAQTVAMRACFEKRCSFLSVRQTIKGHNLGNFMIGVH